MEQAFTKDRILELYLNEIFLGNRSYGVAAAALNYFNKPLDELTIAKPLISPPCPRRRIIIIPSASMTPPSRGGTG